MHYEVYMEVLSNSADVSSVQAKPATDDASQPTSPTDILFSLLLQDSPVEADVLAESTEIKPKPSKNQNIDPAEQPNNVDYNALLQQLSLMNAPDLTTQANTSEEQQQVTQPDVKAGTIAASTAAADEAKLPVKSEASVLTDKLSQSAISNDNAKNLQTIMPLSPEAQNTIVSTLATNDSDAAQAANAANVKPDVKNKVQTTANDSQAKSELSHSQSQLLDSENKSVVFSPIQHAMNNKKANNNLANNQAVTQADASSPASPSAASIVGVEGQKHASQPSNKYTEALSQLGNFINSHTMKERIINQQNLIADTRAGVGSYSAELKDAQHIEYDSKIELPLPSAAALAKETYDAKIKIYPPELGSVTATLKVDKNDAQLVIMAESSRVKEIIEANLPQLRENFQNANINLTHVQVQVALNSDSSKEQGNQNQSNNRSDLNKDPLNDQNLQSSPEKLSSATSNKLVDTYA